MSGVTPGAAAAVDDGAATASPAPGGAAELRQLGAQDLDLMHGLLQVFGEAFDDPATYTGRCPDADYLRRLLGGALFGDRRYGQVFVYHNGAQSYYAARGFCGRLRV